MFYHKPVVHGRLDKHGKLVKKGKQVVLFKNYDGFALPLYVLKIISSVEIHYGGKTYQASPDTFYKHGIEHTFEDPRTFKQEKQLVLPRKYWNVPDQASLL